MRALILTRTNTVWGGELVLQKDLEEEGVEVEGYNFNRLDECEGPYDLVAIFGLTAEREGAYKTIEAVQDRFGTSTKILAVGSWFARDIAEELKEKYDVEYEERRSFYKVTLRAFKILNITSAVSK